MKKTEQLDVVPLCSRVIFFVVFMKTLYDMKLIEKVV